MAVFWTAVSLWLANLPEGEQTGLVPPSPSGMVEDIVFHHTYTIKIPLFSSVVS